MMSKRRAYLRRIDDRGAVAAMYALSLFALVGIAGVAFDYSRVAGMDSELQNGADQAALAGATQLDKDGGACARATNAAIALLNNPTLLANDNGGKRVLINGGNTISVDDNACTGITGVTFYEDKDKTVLATKDADAAFIQVAVDMRVANYAFTPVVGLLNSGKVEAKALAGLGSSVCKVPPIMICSPDPTTPFDAAGRQGIGVVATGHATGNNGGSPGTGSNNTWAPGDFGFLQVGSSTGNTALLQALAYDTPPIDCTPIGENNVSTGNPQGLYDAINTRFDIYDFPSNNGGGNVLSSCQGGDCPPSPNVTKDLVHSGSANSCRIQNGNGAGWHLPDAGTEYAPGPTANASGSYNPWPIAAMGLPRDLCHYTTYNSTGLCNGGASGRYGDGNWDRYDYFQTNHMAETWPAGWASMTRYQTYLWELGEWPDAGSTHLPASATPMCYSGTKPETSGRRVLTVAVVDNCADLHGTSTEVHIDQWVDMFLVEPSIDKPAIRHDAFSDAIYFEVIGPSKLAGDGSYASQLVRRDVPYLVQ